MRLNPARTYSGIERISSPKKMRMRSFADAMIIAPDPEMRART